MTTAVIVALLAFPLGANLDTGNINLQLTLMLWAAQFTGPRLSGLLWALATWMKWVPVVFWVILEPRAKRFGLIWLCLAILLSIALLPLTIQQFQALFGFGARPIRLDYLIYIWAFIPWLYRHDLRAEVARSLAAVRARRPRSTPRPADRPRGVPSPDRTPR